MTTKTVGGSSVSYAYDSARNMKSCAFGNGRTNFYYYDHARRLVKEVHTCTGVVEESSTFVYDGMDIVARVDNLSGEMVYFTRGLGIAPGVGDVLAETHILGSLTQTYVCVQNHRGDTISLVDGLSGTVVAQYDYSAWGEITSHTGSNAFFTFSGKHLDADAGLYYYGYRWYDAVAKRWTQPDPEGLAEGLDLYRFCGNDPVNMVDRRGLDVALVVKPDYSFMGYVDTYDVYYLGWDRATRGEKIDRGYASRYLPYEKQPLPFYNGKSLEMVFGPELAASMGTAIKLTTHVGSRPFMWAGTIAKRYERNCELGNSPWFAALDAANLAAGDIIGYTMAMEGAFGIDRATMEDIDPSLCRLYMGLGAIQTVTFAAGASMALYDSGLTTLTRAEASLPKWMFGNHKTPQKWVGQMNARGWTMDQITEAMQSGEKTAAPNTVNAGNTATRYVHPITKRGVIVDDAIHEVLQVEGDKWTLKDWK